MEKEVFKFTVKNLSFGWCYVVMLINDKRVSYNAEYMGPNPLASFIEACAELMEYPGNYYIKWRYHDMILKIDMNLDEDEMLHLDIFDQNEGGDTINEEWHETIPFEDFVTAIISEGFRVLNAFGLYGYQQSWQNHEDFPLTNLLRITGKCKEIWKGDSCCTDISKEIECLQFFLDKTRTIEEKSMNECMVYYESWQIQCCGKPFSVGEKVEWTCKIPSDYKNAHGIIIDFDEDHHGFPTNSITGTVTKILAERSEFPKGEKEVWYERAKTIQEELQHADGKESVKEDDDSTERTFWGYIVELHDVTIKPLAEDNKKQNLP